MFKGEIFMIKCPKCQELNPDGSKQCCKCGADLADSNQSVSEQAQQTAVPETYLAPSLVPEKEKKFKGKGFKIAVIALLCVNLLVSFSILGMSSTRPAQTYKEHAAEQRNFTKARTSIGKSISISNTKIQSNTYGSSKLVFTVSNTSSNTLENISVSFDFKNGTNLVGTQSAFVDKLEAGQSVSESVYTPDSKFSVYEQNPIEADYFGD